MSAYSSAVATIVEDYLDGKTVTALLMDSSFEQDQYQTSVADISNSEISGGSYVRVDLEDVVATAVDGQTVAITCSSPLNFGAPDSQTIGGVMFVVDDMLLAYDTLGVEYDSASGDIKYAVPATGLVAFAMQPDVNEEDDA